MLPHALRAAVRPLTLALLTSAMAGALGAQPPAGQGPGGQPPRFENLKVFSKDIPRDSLLGIMRGFTTALGVNCQYCHVSETVAAGAPGGPPGGPPGGGPPGPRERLRPAADDKQTKQTARFMIRMADSLNRAVLTALPVRHSPAIAVSCVTCHHGSPLPQTIDVALAETAERAGIDSAIARYRQLRGDMVSGRYDFREGPMIDLAQRLTAGGKTPDAIKLLQTTQEFFPSSANVDMALADTYFATGDKAQAITRYRAALAKRPNDQRARQRLQDLGAPADPAAPAPGRPSR